MMEDCAIKYYNEGKAKILYSFPEYVFKEMLIRSKLILIYMKGRFQIFKIFDMTPDQNINGLFGIIHKDQKIKKL